MKIIERAEAIDRKWYPWIWIALSLIFLVIDYLAGPLFQFPFLYIIPVFFASSLSGKYHGILLGLLLSLAHLIFSFHSELPWPFYHSVINLLIRVLVFTLIALLVDKITCQMNSIKILTGLLPICASCKKIRNTNQEWVVLEKYLLANSEATFTHGICPECMKELYPHFKA